MVAPSGSPRHDATRRVAVGMPLRESNTDGDALRAAGTAAK